MNKLQKNIVLLSIALISFLMHYNHFSKDLISIHAWRQTYTQTTINNFYEEDMSILNPRKNDRGNTDGVYRMEFPLMQWIVASVYKITGNHIVVSRIIMFLIGMLSVAGIYCLLKNLFNNLNLAIIGAWAFNFSPSFYYYTINPMPDNLALCCSIWGLALFFSWIKNNNIYHLFISGILLSIGTLCKLPFITFYMVPIVYFPLHFSKNKLNKKQLSESISVLGFILAPLSWYLYVIPGWKGNPIVKGMFDNSESAGNLVNYLLHNTISTLPELLLNYGSLPFFFSGFYFLFKNKKLNNTKFYMLLGLCLSTVFYYLFELNAIARVHDYYLFPFYPILFIIVAYGAYNMITHSQTLKYITFMLLLLLPFTCYLRMKDRWNIESPGFDSNLLIYKNELRAAVPEDALVVAGNDESHSIFFYYIDKKGWSFQNDNLTSDSLKEMINKGASYLYTDSDIIISSNQKLLDSLITEKGTIKVYKLKTNYEN